MKKFAALILALMLVLLSVPSLAEEGSTFIMGFDAEYPPYTYMGDDASTPVLTSSFAKASATFSAGTWSWCQSTGIRS